VTGTCGCGCGASLAGLRSDATYASEACSRRARRAASPDKARTEHPLVEAREAQEATKLKDHYSQVIYQGIIKRLERGPVHADDLEDLFPDSDRTMCRKLVGAQFGSLASRHYIREKERRKSSIASRKGAKSSVWEFTQKGRERLAGYRAGGAGDHLLSHGVGTASSPASGESGAEGRGEPGMARTSAAVKALGSTSPSSSTQTGKGSAQTHSVTLDRPASSHDDSLAGARLLDDGVTGSSAAPLEAVGEPTALPGLEGPPSAYDPYSEAA
jgi:hypothetical protein